MFPQDPLAHKVQPAQLVPQDHSVSGEIRVQLAQLDPRVTLANKAHLGQQEVKDQRGNLAHEAILGQLVQ